MFGKTITQPTDLATEPGHETAAAGEDEQVGKLNLGVGGQACPCRAL
jgi:hypothetical protein